MLHDAQDEFQIIIFINIATNIIWSDSLTLQDLIVTSNSIFRNSHLLFNLSRIWLKETAIRLYLYSGTLLWKTQDIQWYKNMIRKLLNIEEIN